MVYATTLFLLLATTAIALPMRGNEGVGHGVGGRLQVTSTGQNSSASHEAKLDAQLEIQDVLARTQFVSSAATNSCQGKGVMRHCTSCAQVTWGHLKNKWYWVRGYWGRSWLGDVTQYFTTQDACDESNCANCDSCPCPRPPPPPSAGCYKNEWAAAGKEETRVSQSGPCMIQQFCRPYAIQEFEKKGETKKKYYGMEYPQGCPKGQAQCLYLTETQVQKWEKLADDAECRVPTEGGSLQGGSYRVYVRPV